MVMTVTKKYHVGVSYANEDQDIVKSVVKALELVGLTVFFDQIQQSSKHRCSLI